MGAPETKDITEEGINDLKFFSKYACYIAVLAVTVFKRIIHSKHLHGVFTLQHYHCQREFFSCSFLVQIK